MPKAHQVRTYPMCRPAILIRCYLRVSGSILLAKGLATFTMQQIALNFSFWLLLYIRRTNQISTYVFQCSTASNTPQPLFLQSLFESSVIRQNPSCFQTHYTPGAKYPSSAFSWKMALPFLQPACPTHPSA